MDDILGTTTSGVGFSEAQHVFARYNRSAVRRIRDIFRTPQLAALTMSFAHENSTRNFTSSSLPFLGAWLGISLSGSNEEMFCSQFVTHYYPYCLGPQYESLIGSPYDGKLSTLYGSGSPTSADIFTPGHYSAQVTPNAPIFDGEEHNIIVEYADVLYIIIQPLIIILFIMIIIWMLLPHPNQTLAQ